MMLTALINTALDPEMAASGDAYSACTAGMSLVYTDSLLARGQEAIFELLADRIK